MRRSKMSSDCSKTEKRISDGIGFNAKQVGEAKPGEYDIVVYRTEDVKSSLVAGTKENLVAEARKSNDVRLKQFRNEPKEFWDKVFDIDFEPHLKQMKELKVDFDEPRSYTNRLPVEMRDIMRARILMFTKMGANEHYSGKGYTLSPDKVDAKGKVLPEAERIRVREYLIDNQKIVDSPPHILIKIK